MSPNAPPDDFATVEPRRSGDAAVSGDQPPVGAWRQYRIVRFLGAGSMGRVYLAHDSRLQRPVAIKFLDSREPELTQLFLREARAQAGIDHPCICKVYEVDEIEGHPYIAMQYIEGLSLSEAASSMTLDQQLVLISQIARGLQEAHRLGSIHRDLKPGNILVRVAEDGRYHPFVLDFGLAGAPAELADWEAHAGTPGFMAPEQARVELSRLDRRTDVHGIGAVLFAMSTGKPPYTGEDPREVMERTRAGQSMDIVEVRADLPADVIAIVRKSLAPEPGERYASARELAEDLARYLSGDPVLAVASHWRYRLAKKIRKHRALFALLAVAAVLLLAVIGWSLVQQHKASRLAQLSGDLTAEVKDIESLTRLSAMSPRHDIRPDRHRLRDRMDRIRQLAEASGALGVGPGHYALGWGYLVQNDLDQARDHLETAWRSGYRPSAVAHGLVLTHAGLYRRDLAALTLTEDPEARKLTRARLEAAYRDPITSYLEAVDSTEVTMPDYLRAMVAFSASCFEDALALLDDLGETEPWFYDPIVTRADIHRELAREAEIAGDETRARHHLTEADSLYEQAQAIAPSDPRLYLARVYTAAQWINAALFTERDIVPIRDRALTQLTRLEEVLPGDGEAAYVRGKLQLAHAREILVAEGDPSRPVEDALDSGHRALAAGFDPSFVYELMGFVHWVRAQWLASQKKDSREAITKAIGALDKVAESARGDLFYNVLARANRSLGDLLNEQGGDACPAYAQSTAAYRKGIALRPDKAAHYSGLANTLVRMARHGACGSSGVVFLEEAAESLRNALRLNPDHVVLHYQLGRVYSDLASGGEGADHTWVPAYAQEAERHFLTARELNPDLVQVFNVLGLLYLSEARFARSIGRDHEPYFRKGLAIFEKGLGKRPDSRLLNQNLAWTLYFRGKLSVRDGEPSQDDLIRAERIVDKALAQGRSLDGLLCLASIYRIRAEALFDSGEDPRVLLEDSEALLGEVLGINPSLTEAHRSMGALLILAARHHQRRGEDPIPLLDRAGDALDRALENGRAVPLNAITAARLAYYRAKWQDFAYREDGLRWIREALSRRPEDRDAHELLKALTELESATSSRE